MPLSIAPKEAQAQASVEVQFVPPSDEDGEISAVEPPFEFEEDTQQEFSGNPFVSYWL